AAVSNAGKRSYQPIDAADGEHLWDEPAPRSGLELSPWVEISGDAPPTLLIHDMNDPVDEVRHSMAYGLARTDAGVPVEMHFYATGGYAFGMRPTRDPITTEWPVIVAMLSFMKKTLPSTPFSDFIRHAKSGERKRVY